MSAVIAWALDAFNAFADEPQHLPTEPMMPSFRVPLAAVVVYWVVLYALKAVLTRTGKVYPVNALFAAHNYILTAISIWLFAGMTYTVFRIGFEYGPLDLYCGTPSRAVNSAALWWGNAFYISKYYELLDTVFLVLRGKPLSVLHMFHHSVVVLVCWLAVHDAQAMGWITVVNNAFVHIFMYFYFARTVLGQRLWWRKYVTQMQIIQFVLDGTTSLPFAYFWYKGVDCNGSMRAWVVGNTTGILLFLLFTQFSREDARKQKALKAKSATKPIGDGNGDTAADTTDTADTADTADARAKAE